MSALGVWPPEGVSERRLQNIPHVISLGAGVQSSTLLFLAASGLITPMPQSAVFADTQSEPREVYNWLDWLCSLSLPFPIVIQTKSNLSYDSLQPVTKRGNLRNSIPVFLKQPDGTRGVYPRDCTRSYKIRVIKRYLTGGKARRSGSLPSICSWIGISTDEADRMKPSRDSWWLSRWPLIELGMSRKDCLLWIQESSWFVLMRKAGFEYPPRSACKQCPYKSDDEWMHLKETEPLSFQEAVDWEKKLVSLASTSKLTGTPFLHRSLVPLDQVKFDPSKGRHNFSNECEGMCGL